MRGGLHLFARKQFPTVRSITAASVPPRLTLTLRSHEVAIEILVATGEEVLLGQTLARSKMAVLHAPVSGRIVAIEVDGALCTVTVENDGRDRPHAGVQPIVDPERLAPTIVRERIAQAGIVGLGGACFPTATKLD